MVKVKSLEYHETLLQNDSFGFEVFPRNANGQNHIEPPLNTIDQSVTTFCRQVVSDQARLKSFECGASSIILDGKSLDICSLVAAACHNFRAERSTQHHLVSQVHQSVDMLEEHLRHGRQIYGVNTGYGGSADTRTLKFASLQQALIQHHNAAVLIPSDLGREALGRIGDVRSHAIPRDIVKGAMIIRCNSLLRGHSAVRIEVIDTIMTMLKHDATPIVPLRGSISASGDLTPLAYIAGALEGNPDIYVSFGQNQSSMILPADQALQHMNLCPVIFGPKEGLGLVNGTAISCAATAIALYDAERLALLSQLLTAMTTEALGGSPGNFHPFIAKIRPHPGQKEVAAVVSHCLLGSLLAQNKSSKDTESLYQDRYATRTASQWLGPLLEDLQLSRMQVTTELNSTTDNPLLDTENNMAHHGGNFQAVALTTATEKVRLALQMVGKLVFAQSSEVINPMTNGVLPPNLCFDDPSLSFAFKGVDINMAAYMSELAYLANPVSSHVQSAEMHNQAVNSLAFISARYTNEAVELVSLMAATHLYLLCQALDLHALHRCLFTDISTPVKNAFEMAFNPILPSEQSRAIVLNVFEKRLSSAWTAHKNTDLKDRPRLAVKDAMSDVLFSSRKLNEDLSAESLLQAIDKCSLETEQLLNDTYCKLREQLAAGDSAATLSHLGNSSTALYLFVRNKLGVSIHRGLVEHPLHSGVDGSIRVPHQDQKTIGSSIGIIYESLRSGQLWKVFEECCL